MALTLWGLQFMVGAQGALGPSGGWLWPQGGQAEVLPLAGSLGALRWLRSLPWVLPSLTFTRVLCLQGNDVRIILGQFDHHMAAKVFCCVSKAMVSPTSGHHASPPRPGPCRP
jgi:hypothetical protein